MAQALLVEAPAAEDVTPAPLTSDSEVFLIKADQWPIYNGYEPLSSTADQIRLLDVKAGPDNNEIVCSLRHVNLVDKPDYCALSYYWGAPVPASALKAVTVDGTIVKIRPAVYSFLASLVLQLSNLPVWLDVICIDQENNEERQSQVSLMGTIFGSARNVYVWLGDADADSDYVFDGLNGVINHDLLNLRILSECLEQLFWRPYWTRMWVIQEFSLAQNITLVCGSRFLEWKQLRLRAVRLRDGKDTEGWLRFDRFAKVAMSHQRPHDSGEKSLFKLMERFQRARCVDPRDKVYALLSLSSDGKHVAADYSISAADLFFRLLSLHPPLSPKLLCGDPNPTDMFSYDEFPWRTAHRIRRCLGLDEAELVKSCRIANNDQPHLWLRYCETVISVQHRLLDQQRTNLPNLVHARGPDKTNEWVQHDVFYRSRVDVWPKDEIFILSFSPSCSPLFVVLRPPNWQLIDLVVQPFQCSQNILADVPYEPAVSLDEFEFLRRVCLNGMSKCETTWLTTSRPSYKKRKLVLVHVTRLVFSVLQLLALKDHATLSSLYDIDEEIINAGLLCSCRPNSQLGNHDKIEYPLPHPLSTCHIPVEGKDFLIPLSTAVYGED
jgi:Heterokaryon incompatibility protein (HET)